MTEPIRERVLVALVDKLEGMTGSRSWGSPYANAIRVERSRLVPESPTQLPLLWVIEGSMDGRGSTVDIEVTAGGEVGLRHEFKVLLGGHIGAAAEAGAPTWRQRLWDDCLKTLMLENTLDGLVMAVRWLPDSETNEGSGAPVATFVQALGITFHETVNTD